MRKQILLTLLLIIGNLTITQSLMHYEVLNPAKFATSFTTGDEVGSVVAKAGGKSVEMSGLRLNAGVYVVTLMSSGEIVASYKFSL